MNTYDDNSLKTNLIKRYFGNMNNEQQTAIGTLTGPVLILAGAGSGKTTVVANRILNMVKYGIDLNSNQNLNESEMQQANEFDDGENSFLMEQIKPRKILAITFTNKAAQELKERLKCVAEEAANSINVGTFHWLCLQISRRNANILGYTSNFTIYDQDDSKRLIKRILKELNISEEMFGVNSILTEINHAKENLLDATAYKNEGGNNYRKSVIATIYNHYQANLKSNNAMDFDDMVMLSTQLLLQNSDILQYYQNRFSHITIDEYQDTNFAQFMLVKLLASARHNICVVGDDDQSIYRFRGANIENILNFEKHFPGTKLIRLEQNYRSTQNILDVANSIIKNNQARKAKTLWTKNTKGTKIVIFKADDEYREAIYVAEKIKNIVNDGKHYSTCTVLYRTNAQSNVLETVFSKKELPYQVFGGQRFYDRKEIKDVLAYLCVVNNQHDDIRLLRVINEPRRKIGPKALSIIEEIKKEESISLFSAAEQLKESRQLQTFVQMIYELKQELIRTTLPDFIDVLIEKTGYKEMLTSTGHEGKIRLENINELKSNLLTYSENEKNPSLEGFLGGVVLYENENQETNADSVKLMTLHAAKGLEFETVFIVGMEEGIFPGNKALFDEKELEEERRLAYVGFTRARNQLFLTHARRRTYLGQTLFNQSSQFIKEIQQELCVYFQETPPSHLGRNKKNTNLPQTRYIGYKKTPIAPINRIKFIGGEKVSHPKFGSGKVENVVNSGNDQLLEITFDKVGKKKLMANYATFILEPS
ncbi:MAG: UvrD-helicase domain-containing protein [Oscillospiraceae bacterium]|nr:UvrD-helicase domain-containing protein [Oscillospiraceae bacterium]